MSGEERAEFTRCLCAVGEHLGFLQALIEAGAPCGQVLRQLCAVRFELRSIKHQMLNCQINASKSILQFDPSVDNRLTELHRLINLYNTLLQTA
jgi:DNA-binding FrmR family transcriptional regulator